MTDQICLGQSVNLASCLDFVPFAELNNKRPYGVTPCTPLVVYPMERVAHPPTFSESISVHYGVDSVLAALFPYRIESSSPTAPVVGISPFLPNVDRQRLNALHQIAVDTGIGMELENKTYVYVLVKLEKNYSQGASVGAFPRRESAWIPAKAALPDGTPNEANVLAYADYINQWGSHYVSAVDFGCVILQVFQFPPEDFENVKQYTNTVANFQPYARPERAPKLVLYQQDDAFTSRYDAGVWSSSGRDWIYSKYTNTSADLSFKLLSNQAPTKVTLTSFTNLLEPEKTPLFEAVLANMLMLKSGYALVTTSYPKVTLPPEYFNTFSAPAALTPLTSVLMTPQVSLFREVLDIGDYLKKIKATASIQSLFLATNFLQVSGRVTLPDTTQIVLIAGVIYGDPATAAELVVSDAVFDAGYFFVGKTVGFVTITTASGKRRGFSSIGLPFDLDLALIQNPPTEDLIERNKISVTKHAIPQLPASLLSGKVPGTSSNTGADRLAVLFNTSFSTVSLNLLKETVEPKILQDYLAFVVALIPHDYAHAGLAAARTRALYLHAGIQPRDKNAPFIPYENYTQYQSLVTQLKEYAQYVYRDLQTAQSQIRDRIAEENLLNSQVVIAQTLNQNIQKTGQLVSGLVEAVANNQDQMNGYYTSLQDKTRNAIAAANINIDRLSGLVTESRNKLNQLKEQIQAEWKEWIDEQKTKSILDIITAIFTLGISVAVDVVTGDIGNLAEIFQKIVDLTKMIIELDKMFKDDGAPSDAAGDAQVLLNGSLSKVPTDDEFQVMATYLKDAFHGAPDDLASKHEWAPAVDALMYQGVAWTHAIVQREVLRLELYKNVELAKISASFKIDLQNQKAKYSVTDIANLDVANINLSSITDYLEFAIDRTCQQLASTYATQMVAVQYQYSADPVSLTQFDLDSLLQVGIQIENNILAAIPKLQPPPGPLTVQLSFPLSANEAKVGGVKYVDIPITQKEFFNYVMVRIREVTFKVEGITYSDSGSYQLDVAYPGDSFKDRDLNRNVRTYRTIPRTYTYIYSADGNNTKVFGGSPTDSKVLRISPFETWEVSFPVNLNNVSLEFAENPRLLVEFKVQAIPKTPKA